MRRLVAAWRLARTVGHGLRGLATVVVVFPFLDAAGRRRRVQRWSAGLLAAIGARLEVDGRPRDGATLLAANHVSWLDIAAIHAVAPHARFVSKADVKRWPLVNRLVDAAGTLYLERERRRDAHRVVHHMAEALAAGDSVAVFPEGTTSDGSALLPFHANLLQAAVAVEVPVQPVALRYADAAERISPAVRFVGDTTLAESLWSVAAADGLVVRVMLLPAIGTRHADRRSLAARVRDEIDAALAR